jgi:hypothetical protein
VAPKRSPNLLRFLPEGAHGAPDEREGRMNETAAQRRQVAHDVEMMAGKLDHIPTVTRQSKAWDAWDHLVALYGARSFPVVMASDYVVPQGPGAPRCRHGWADMGPSSRPCRCPGKRVGKLTRQNDCLHCGRVHDALRECPDCGSAS